MNKQKGLVMGLSVLVLLSASIIHNANAEQIVNGKVCNHWCFEEYNAKKMYEQLQVEHGQNYGHQFAHQGWGSFIKYDLNRSVSR